MLDETPAWLKKAAEDLLRADSERANDKLREQVETLEAALAASEAEVSRLARRLRKELKTSELNIKGLILWGLGAHADPTDAMDKVSPETLDLILDNQNKVGPDLGPPKKLSCYYDARSIIERGRCLELEMPDDLNPKGDSNEKTNVD